MHILIAGGTGLVGQHMIHQLNPDHTFTVLSRNVAHVKKKFGESVHACSWESLNEFDAKAFDVVINLAGYNISASRWNEKVKQKIIDSRVKTNEKLIDWLIRSGAKSRYYSANAVGIYGAQEKTDDKELDETDKVQFSPPKDFLNEVGMKWQQSVQKAIDHNIPVTITRFGVVIKKEDGMLGKLSLPYQLGLGSVIGDGQQVISWIDIDDLVRAYEFLLTNPTFIGSYNVTSPNPVTQKEFAKSLAKALNRPLFLKTPQFVIRLLLGEMGEYLINRGQRVIPKRLTDEGFSFKYPTIESSLEKELQSNT